MTDKFKQTIKEEMTTLPKESQEVINTFDWAKVSGEIGKIHFLDESEINDLQVLTGLILVGIGDSDLLAKDIEEYVGTSRNEAEKISEEITEKIFMPIVKNLKDKIKTTMKDRVTHWQQNLDFILSGGDYTAFIRRVEPDKKDEIPKGGYQNLGPSKMDDLKSKFTI